MNRWILSGRTIAVWLLLWPASSGSPSLAAGGETVRLGVEVVYASNEGQRIDPSLARVERQLRASFRYSSYRRLDSHELVRSIGQQGTVPLPGGRTLLLVPQGVSGGSVVLLASIQGGGRTILNTELKLANGGSILVGGPAHEAGVLILAITAATP